MNIHSGLLGNSGRIQTQLQDSFGGGRDIYSNIDGDMPIALRSVASLPSAGENGLPFIVLSYNVRSLDSGHRLEMLLAELKDRPWDLIVIVETWRESSEEFWKTSDGHMFCGAGGCKGKRGVAFLLHKCWAFDTLIEDSFARATERIASLDLQIHGRRFRVIAAYFPHSGYSDAAVQSTYDILENLVHEGRRKGLSTILAGDFNAEVGTDDNDLDDRRVIGENGITQRNDRGRWLLNWCGVHGFCISNTHFTNIGDETWTYTNGGICRQLDFILVDLGLFKMVSYSNAIGNVDIGSDHRPVSMCLLLQMSCKKKWSGSRGPAKWEVCKVKYHEALDKALEDYPVSAESLSDSSFPRRGYAGCWQGCTNQYEA